MTEIELILKRGNPFGSGSGVFLKGGSSGLLQVAFDIEDYARTYGVFDENAAEFAYFASAIYACDRAVRRERAEGDRWTRELAVSIPVMDVGKWTPASKKIEAMLEFLTGDIWHLSFVRAPRKLFGKEFKSGRECYRKRRRAEGSAVALFSGGLDSLIGAIDWLESKPSGRLLLASTYDSQAEGARGDQLRLLPHLEKAYDGRVQRFVARTGLCGGGADGNFRGRSLSFIGNAVLAASFLGAGTSIIVPENGGIALNYPLSPARRGSLSTRTVHPRFIRSVQDVLATLGFEHNLVNPYISKTKGEMVYECMNPVVLREAYPYSASCGKRGHRVYWEDRHARQCGACVPCLFRRAGIHHAGLPRERYGYRLSEGPALSHILSGPNNDLTTVIDFIERNDDEKVIWRNLQAAGQFGPAEKVGHVSLVVRLRDELTRWAESLELLRR